MLLQLYRHVAGGVFQGLAVLIVGWDSVSLLPRHLDEVPLAVPVADLQGLEPGLEALVGLVAGEPVVGTVAELAGLVQLCRVAGADDLARLFGDGGGYELPDPWR